MTGSTRIKAYRADIDGLRAVAVLLVVGYHLGFWTVSGGFIGVDIFFVISGFLISGHILAELRADKFRFSDFYERRIRRIFPALFAMLFAVGTVAYLVLLPFELQAFAKSAAAAALSVSNVLFYRQSGYFDTPSASKPLLHTWSLGVEEQFYLVLPLALVLLWRWKPTRVFWSAGILAALTFAASVAVMRSRPEAAFYLAPFRAWELLIGTLLAAAPKRQVGRAAREAIALTGLGLIGWAAVFYDPRTVFPGVTALAPAIGAGFVIMAGGYGESWVGRLLSLRPATAIGLISYSLYLWHWPVVVFTSMGTIPLGVSSHTARYGLLLVSLVLAGLSWRFVEMPFRYGRLRMRRRFLFPAAAGAIACALLFSGATVSSGGWQNRFPPKAVRVASYLDYDPNPAFRAGRCFISNSFASRDYDYSECLHVDPAKGRTILLVGDSHAAHLWYGFSRAFRDENVLQATASGCKALVVDKPTARPDCRRVIEYAFNSFLPGHPNAEVILASRWTRDDVEHLAATIKWLRERGYRSVVIGPIPEYDGPLPRLLARAVDRRDSGSIVNHEVAAVWALDSLLQHRAAELKVPYVSLVSQLCVSRSCLRYAVGDSVPLQFDYGHLTAAGSELVATRMRAQVLLAAKLSSDSLRTTPVLQAGTLMGGDR